MRIPDVSDRVHYVHPRSGICLAAIVTSVAHAQASGWCELHVFASRLCPLDVVDFEAVYDASGIPGTWHYPQSEPRMFAGMTGDLSNKCPTF